MPYDASRPLTSVQSAEAGPRTRSDFDRFHASALNASAHGPLGPGKSAADRNVEGDVLRFEHHARKIAQDHFDPAHFIDAAAGTVDILHTHTDPFDRVGKFFEPPTQSLPDERPLVLAQTNAEHPDVGWNQPYISTAGFSLIRFGNPTLEP